MTQVDCGSPAIDETSATGDALRVEVGKAIAVATHTEWETLGIYLGYRYENSPICVSDGTTATEDSPRYYTPTTRPGHRAPHAWLEDGQSTLDLFGRGLVLLRLGSSPLNVDALVDAAKARNVPLTVVDIASPAVTELYERKIGYGATRWPLRVAQRRSTNRCRLHHRPRARRIELN